MCATLSCALCTLVPLYVHIVHCTHRSSVTRKINIICIRQWPYVQSHPFEHRTSIVSRKLKNIPFLIRCESLHWLLNHLNIKWILDYSFAPSRKMLHHQIQLMRCNLAYVFCDKYNSFKCKISDKSIYRLFCLFDFNEFFSQSRKISPQMLAKGSSNEFFPHSNRNNQSPGDSIFVHVPPHYGM